MVRRIAKILICLSICIFTCLVVVEKSVVYAQYPGTITRPYNYQTDLYTGRFSTSIPIFATPGRKGVMPGINLNYSSTNSNGIVGVGWSLDVGQAQKNTKFGSVQYDTAPYILLINGSIQELTQTAANQYRAKDEGSFWQYTYNGANAWSAYDKEGTYYQFTDSLTDPNGYYFSSYLTKVTDVHGNYIEITYLHDGTNLQVYPEEIKYTGNQTQGDGTTASIKFYYETRPDAITSYREGFQVITAKRLSYIEVRSQGELVRKYTLAYNTSISSSRSLLTGITEYGSDGVTAQPPITFTYEPGPGNSFYLNKTDWTQTSQTSASPIPLDYNNDGKTDCVTFNNSTGNWYFAKSTGTSFTAPELKATFGAGKQPLLGDFNGDGKIDIGYYKYDEGIKIKLGTGPGTFAAETTWLGPFATWSYQAITGDFNADGKTDILFYEPYNGYWHFAYSNGQAFQYPIHVKTAGGGASNVPFTGDFNGDGYTDIGYYNRTADYINVYIWTVHPNWNTNSFVPWLTNFYFPSWAYPTYNIQTADFNADGMSDLVFFDPIHGYWWIAASKGNTLGWPCNWLAEYCNNTTPITGDFDGDGVLDYGGYTSGTGKWTIGIRTNGDESDVMKQLNNGIGGKISLTYAPSTQFDNTGEDENPDLSLIFPVVTSMTTEDGVGNTTTLNYFYQDGSFDMTTRELRGFSFAKITDPDGNTKEVYYHQSPQLKGKPYREETKQAGTTLYQKTETNWQYTTLSTNSYFSYLESQDTYLYDPPQSSGGQVALPTPKHTKTGYTYDVWGNPTQTQNYGDYDQNGDEIYQQATYTYNDTLKLHAHPAVSIIKDANLNTISQTWYYYDGNLNYTDAPTKGLLTQETHWLETNPSNPIDPNNPTNPVILYQYDNYGNLTQATDPKGNTAATTYDATHTYPIQVTNSKGYSSQTTYDYKTGKVLTTTDANNQITTYQYDCFGRYTKIIGPNDTENLPTIQYTYYTSSCPWKMTVAQRINPGSAETKTVHTFYDGLHREIQTKTEAEDPAYQVLSGQKTYNHTGQIIKSYLPYIVPNTGNNYTTPDTSKPNTQYQYDSLGRLSQITAPDGTTTKTQYNQWQLTVTDANNNQLTKIQDAYGRIKQIKEFNNNETYTTNYTYDPKGSLTQTQDQLGNTVQISYDTLGRKTQTTDPDMGTWTYSYDANGNLISQTDAKGQTITFTYDSLNRLTRKLANDIDVNYTYDDPAQNYTVGKLTKVQDNASQTTFEYDNLGREIKSTKTIDATPYTIQRTYDGVNRLTSLTYPDGEQVNYTYNNRSQIETIASAETTYLQNADYNQNDQLTQITLGNGVITHYTYNEQTKLLSNLITTDSQNNQIQNLSYSFDNIGNILGITDAVHSTSQTFAYDNLSRLTSAAIVGAGAPPARYYTYDATGNILSKDGINYSYNSTRPHAVTDLSDGSAYTYDASGNMQTRHTPDIALQYLNYNTENRLINIQDAFQNTICSFVYDGDGGRIKKTSSLRSASGGEAISTTTYIGSLYEITDSPQSSGGQAAITKHIFKGSTRLASKTNSTNPNNPTNSITYYHGDHLGSSNLLTDENGLEIKRIEYEPFGTSYVDTGTGQTNYRYTGKELDGATGLYYYGARYYDAKLGRFITPDSIVQNPLDPQTLNRYAYCRNNPLKYTDPSGHFFFIVAAICAVVKAVAAVTVAIVESVATVVAAAAKAAAVIAAAHPIATGAALGAATGGISAAASGGNIARGMLVGAVVGGLTGNLLGSEGFLSGVTSKIASSAIRGGIIGAAAGGMRGCRRF